MLKITALPCQRSRFTRTVAGFLLALLPGPAMAGAQPDETPCFENQYAFTALVENDLWGSGSDKHFTNGGRLSLVVSREQVGELGSCRDDRSGFVETVRDLADVAGGTLGFKTRQLSLIVGQNIFTPEDISRQDLILYDRPYAGWLYVGFGLIAEREGRFNPVDTFELDLGVVGPWSLAETVQKNWHEFINTVEPKGWDNQLMNSCRVWKTTPKSGESVPDSTS